MQPANGRHGRVLAAGGAGAERDASYKLAVPDIVCDRATLTEDLRCFRYIAGVKVGRMTAGRGCITSAPVRMVGVSR